MRPPECPECGHLLTPDGYDLWYCGVCGSWVTDTYLRDRERDQAIESRIAMQREEAGR